ncbi:MAG: nitroreductase family protein [Rhizomicrobium sp.]
MELLEAIYQRRAVREFRKQPVARNTLQELVDAAIQAPSAMNAQPWHFTIVRNPRLLDQISSGAKRFLLDSGGAPDSLRMELSDPAFHIFYNAPALVLISAPDAGWTREDAALAAENLMLAAHDQGLGTCWIGLAQGWLGTKEGRRAIDLAENLVPVAPIIVGHPVGNTPQVPRKPPAIRWMD